MPGRGDVGSERPLRIAQAIAGFLFRKEGGMLLKITDQRYQTRIYRDARLWLALPAPISMIILFGAFKELDDKAELFQVSFFIIGGLVFAWLMLRWIMHGSITLNKKSKRLEFSKSFNLDAVEYTVRAAEIDQVKVKSYYNTGSSGGSSASYKLILGIKKRRGYEEKELSLFFTSWDDSAEAAKLIGKFADKPAFDSVGRQVFTPAS